MAGSTTNIPIQIQSDANLGVPQARLISASPAIKLLNSGNAFALEVDGSQVAAATELQYSIALKTSNATSEQSISGTVKVLPPQSNTTGQIATAGGSVVSSDGYGVSVNAGQLQTPLEVTVKKLTLPTGEALLRLDFNRNLSNSNELIDLHIGNSTASTQSVTRFSDKKFSTATTSIPDPLASVVLGDPVPFTLYLPNSNRISKLTSLNADEQKVMSCPYLKDATAEQQAKLSICVVMTPAYKTYPPKVRHGGEPVIFIHGFTPLGDFGGGDKTWGDFKSLLSSTASRNDLPYDVYEFTWRTTQRFGDAAADLKAFIEKIRSSSPYLPVHLVAHSFGGLVVRALIQGQYPGSKWANPSDYIASVLTFGAPHSGMLSTAEMRQGVDMPVGIDNLIAGRLATLCNQLSCYQAGHPIAAVDLHGSQLNIAARSVYGLEDRAGDFAAKLADWSYANAPMPVDIPITVAIGLQEDSPPLQSETKLHNGDGLISFFGQRVHPSLVGASPPLDCGAPSQTVPGAAALPLLTEVMENYPTGGFNYPEASVDPATISSYQHTSSTPGSVGSPAALQEVYLPIFDCPFADTCKHGAIKVFQRHMTGICKGASQAMQRARVASISCQLSKFPKLICTAAGVNLPSSGMTLYGAGCINSPQTGDGSTTSRQFSECTPTQLGVPAQLSVTYDGKEIGSDTVLVLPPAPGPAPTIQATSTTVGIGDTIQLWIDNAWATIKSVVFNFASGVANFATTVANVVGGVSEKISGYFTQAGQQVVTAIFKNDVGGNGVTLGQGTITLDVGAASIASASIAQVVDDSVSPSVVVASGGSTPDTTPMLSGTVSGALGFAQVVRVYDGSTILGVASLTGTNWTFTPGTPLAQGSHSFTVLVFHELLMTQSATSAAYSLTIAPISIGPGVDGLPLGVPALHILGQPVFQAPAPELNNALAQITPTATTTGQYLSAGSGCVLDTASGLHWELKTASNVGATLTNLANDSGVASDAAAYVKTMNANNFCGFSDWRLPTATELQGLVQYTTVNPAIAYLPFVDAGVLTQSANYWTQDGYVNDNTNAWVVNFNDGGVNTRVRTGLAAVRLVRGAPAYPRPAAPPNPPPLPLPIWGMLNDTGQFAFPDIADLTSVDSRSGRDVTRVNHRDGAAGFSFAKVLPDGSVPAVEPTSWACVYDNVTGLTWEGKTSANTGSSYTNLRSASQIGDADAYVSQANAARLCGHADWRLPHVDELQNIVHYGTGGAAIDVDFFPFTQTGNYWTYDVYSADTTVGWAVNFGSGGVSTVMRNGSAYLRLVRGTPVVVPRDPPTVAVTPPTVPNAGALNDTGQLQLYGFVPLLVGADSETGRDVAFHDDTDGLGGFSFVKLDAAGNTLTTADVTWTCVLDNLTGMVWDARESATTYTYDEANGAAQVANTAGLCGRSDWHVPSIDELQNIVYYGAIGSAVDSWFFPNVLAQQHWSKNLYANDTSNAWVLNFSDGGVATRARSSSLPVRLISGVSYLAPP